MANITGNSSNVQINAADLVLTDTTKMLIAPKAEFSNIGGVSLLTTGRVGVSNAAPGHTFAVGSNVYIDDTASDSEPVLNVIGRLKATTIDFQTGGTDGGIFFNDAGDLNTDTDGLSFNKTTNVITVGGGIVSDGALDLNSTADISDTVVLSKGSGVALEVSTGGTTLVKDLFANATTITDGLTVSSGNTSLAADLNVRTDKLSVTSSGITTSGDLGVTGDTTLTGTLDANSSADIADTLTLSKGSGVALEVSAGGATNLKTLTANNTDIIGLLDVTGATTMADNLTVRSGRLVVNASGISTNSAAVVTGDLTARSGKLRVTDAGMSTDGTLDVSGVSRIGTVFANTTTITDRLTVSDGGLYVTTGGATVSAGGLTVSSGTTTLQAMTATDATVSGTTIINGSGNALQVSNNATINGTLQVNGNLNVDGELTVLTTNNLIIQDPIIELGNVHAQGLGVSYDTGMVFTQPSGSNVATWYDITGSGTYRIAKTNNSAHDTSLEPDGSIEVEVTGNMTSTGNVNASDALVTGDLSMGSGNIRISGNTIYFT